MIQTPCISICKLEASQLVDVDSVCIGCFRSVDEIRIWFSSTEQEKEQILENIKQRKLNRAWK